MKTLNIKIVISDDTVASDLRGLIDQEVHNYDGVMIEDFETPSTSEEIAEVESIKRDRK